MDRFNRNGKAALFSLLIALAGARMFAAIVTQPLDGGGSALVVSGAAFEPPVVHGLESGWMTAKSSDALLLKRIKGSLFSIR